jgi:hypothetical protein
MKEEKLFKIIEQLYYDYDGKTTSRKFYIKEKIILFGFIPYWKYIKHQECNWSDCYMTKTPFNSQKEASDFIKTVLCPNIPRGKYIKNTVETIKCS